MKILLTNDDGYQAEGLNFLVSFMQKRGHDVYIVAPHREQSGKSHSITLQDTIRLHRHFEKIWVLEGTPADCVHLGLLGLLPITPDLVLSGINHGYNIGIDVIYSGTVAAARQGAIGGIPSIALSSGIARNNEMDAGNKNPHINYELIEQFLDKNWDVLVEAAKDRHILNINFPNIETDQCKGARKTQLSLENRYRDELVTFHSPHQGVYYWIKGSYCYCEDKSRIDTDLGAVHHGYISVSALNLVQSDSTVNREMNFVWN